MTTNDETETPEIVVTQDVGAVAGRRLLDAIEAVTRARGRCRLALSGGTAPIPVMQWLAGPLASDTALVERLVVTWIDERHLPLPSMPPLGQRAADGDTAAPHGGGWHGFDGRALPEESNLRLAWEHLLSRLPVLPALVPMARPEPLDEAAARYSDVFSAVLGGIDVALLGVGPDGHIASLFPGHPALQATGVAVAVPDGPKPPPQRISLTLPVLEDVDHAVLVALGDEKASVLRRALAGDDSIPLGRYRPRGTWTWILDPAAAAALPTDATVHDSSSQEST